MKSDYDYLDGKFSEDHVFSYQDVAYCMDIAREPMQEDLDIAIEALEKSWCVSNGVNNRAEENSLDYEQSMLLCNYLEEILSKLRGE